MALSRGRILRGLAFRGNERGHPADRKAKDDGRKGREIAFDGGDVMKNRG